MIFHNSTTIDATAGDAPESAEDLRPVQAQGVIKRFRLGRRKEWNEALHGVDFSADVGEFVSIVGPSGSGKSTLLYCLSGLESVDGGSVRLGGTDITRMSRQDVSVVRRNTAGFIFQDYNLIDSLTGRANIELSLRLCGHRAGQARQLAEDAMGRLGVGYLAGAYPSDMSGGERQRIAIARTLACSPGIVFADEPTGALDSKNADIVVGLLRQITETGTTVIMVTHSRELAARTDRTVVLRDGRIVDSITHAN